MCIRDSAQIAGAVIASFVPNGVDFQAPPSCQRFPGFSPEFEAPSIQLIDADNTVRRIALPAEVTEGDLANSPEVSLIGAEDGLIVVLDRSVWRLDTETEAWTMLFEVPTGPLAFRDYVALPTGQVVALLSQGVAVVVDVATGDSNSLNIEDLNGLPIILYADDEVVITPGSPVDDETRTIDLTEPQPVRGAFPGESGDE